MVPGGEAYTMSDSHDATTRKLKQSLLAQFALLPPRFTLLPGDLPLAYAKVLYISVTET